MSYIADDMTRKQCSKISAEAETRNQRRLHDNLEPLCENNGVPVFQQWRLFSKKFRWGDTNCLCSKNIHKLFTLQNVFNMNLATPIGCDCVQRWFSGNNIQEDIKEAKKMDRMQKAGRYPCCVEGCDGYSCNVSMAHFGCSKCFDCVCDVEMQHPKRPSSYHKKTWGELWKSNRSYCEWIYKHKCMTIASNTYVKAWLYAKIKSNTIVL